MTSWTRCVAALATGAVLALPAWPQSAPRVQRIAVHGTQTLEVEIQISAAITPVSQTVPSPDRIVVDFPGALPAAELRPLKVNRGVLKGIRIGLFSANPPITRVVLDLTAPQSYQVFATRNAVMLKLNPTEAAASQPALGVVSIVPVSAQSSGAVLAPAVQNSSPLQTNRANAGLDSAATSGTGAAASLAEPAPPSKPPVEVSFQNGLLRIRANKATLAQVLYEVHRQTNAEIAIPAGAEAEQVVADLGPGPARDVLAALLNGSPYNFIFVGNDDSPNLEKVILSQRDNSIF